MNTLTIDIREAVPQDALQLVDTHQVSWKYSYNGLLPYHSLRQIFERRNEKWWRKVITSTANVMVVDVAGVIAGYTTFGKNRVDELVQEGEIYELYLRPEFLGVGLGRKLFQEARRFLHSMTYRGCIIWTLEENIASVRFYQAMGGQKIASGYEVFEKNRFSKIAYAWS